MCRLKEKLMQNFLKLFLVIFLPDFGTMARVEDLAKTK